MNWLNFSDRACFCRWRRWRRWLPRRRLGAAGDVRRRAGRDARCDSGAVAVEYALLASGSVMAIGMVVRILALRMEVILWRVAVVLSYIN